MGSLRPSIRGSISFFAVSIAMLPALAVPLVSYAPIAEQKGPIAVMILSIAILLSAIVVGRGGAHLELTKGFAAYAGVPLFLIACASTLLAWRDLQGMIVGRSIEVGTLFSFALFALSIIAGWHIRSTSARLVPKVFLVATAIAAVLASVLYLFGEDGSRGFLGGSIEQLPLLLAAALLLSALIYDTSTASSRAYVAGLFALCGAMYIFWADARVSWLSLAALLPMMAIVVVLRRRPVPWLTIAACVCLTVPLFAHVSIEKSARGSEAKPSFLATSLITGSIFSSSIEHLFLGEGPNSFSYSWNKYRMPAFNMSEQWSMTPREGNSTIMSIAGMLGLFGVLGFLCIPAMLLLLGLSKHKDHERLLRALPACSVVLLFFAASCVYTIELPLLLFAGLMIGGVASILAGGSDTSQLLKLPRSVVASLLFAGTLVAAAVWIGQIATRQFIAADLYQRGRSTFSVEPESGLRYMERAFRTWADPYYAIETSAAYSVASQYAYKNEQTESGSLFLKGAASLAGSAADKDPADFDAWLTRARYGNELLLHNEDVDPADVREYVTQAHSYAPSRPDVLYEEARLDIILGDRSAARKALEAAIALKPDYAEALDLISRLTLDRAR